MESSEARRELERSSDNERSEASRRTTSQCVRHAEAKAKRLMPVRCCISINPSANNQTELNILFGAIGKVPVKGKGFWHLANKYHL